MHSRLITHAEEVAFYGGNNTEKNVLTRAYQAIVEQVRLSTWWSFYYLSQATCIICLVTDPVSAHCICIDSNVLQCDAVCVAGQYHLSEEAVPRHARAVFHEGTSHCSIVSLHHPISTTTSCIIASSHVLNELCLVCVVWGGHAYDCDSCAVPVAQCEGSEIRL